MLENNCTECGIFVSGEGDGYAQAWPSDCHDRGGHYLDRFNASGQWLWSSAPGWLQNTASLTEEEMARARQEYAEFQAKLSGGPDLRQAADLYWAGRAISEQQYIAAQKFEFDE